MDIKTNARWFVIAGAALAFVGFFLPSMSISFTGSTLGFSMDTSEAISFSDLADGYSSIFIIPICFVATIVLNFLYHSESIKSDQKKIIFFIEWGTLLFGFIFSIYWFFRIRGMLTGTSDTFNESLFGLFASTDFKILPGFGFVLLTVGVGIGAYGLQADGLMPNISLPSMHQKSGAQTANYPQQGIYPDQRYDGFDDEVQTGEQPNSLPQYAPPDQYYDEGANVASFNPVDVAAPVIIAPQPEQRKKKISAWLVSKEGQNYQLSYGSTTIGRASSNDIQLMNSKISKQHAKIVELNGRFKLIDLGSTNGTWLNGKMLRNPEILRSEDVIRFGDSFSVQFVAIDQKKI